MKKLRFILIPLLLLPIVFGGAIKAQAIGGTPLPSELTGGGESENCSILSNPICVLMQAVSKLVGSILLGLTSLIAYLGGLALNASAYFTVVQMSTYYNDLPVIASTWGVVRDVANMGFIFVLLFLSIQMILGAGKDRGLIVRVIIAAILINFSLFFTRVIIDAANILALNFYTNITGTTGGTGVLSDFASGGISNAFISLLNLQTLWQAPNVLTQGNIITVGIMGSIFLLVAAFTFFAIAILLVIRYVVLILVMILSPLMFISSIAPGFDGYRKKWWDALLGQAFFAPIYFFLTWITVVVAQGIQNELFKNLSSKSLAEAFVGATSVSNGQNVVTHPADTISLILFFAIVIISILAALLIAKKQAEKAGPYASMATKWALGLAGGATIGLAGRAGRNIIGSRAAATASNDDLKKRAAEGSMSARLQLAAANKLSKASFDFRGTGAGKGLDAGKAQKGGFVQDQKDRAKVYETYKPSEGAQKEATTKATEAEKTYKEAVSNARKAADNKFAEHDELRIAKTELENAQKAKTPELVAAEEAFKNAEREAGVPRGLNESDADYQARINRLQEAKKRVEEESNKNKQVQKPKIEAAQKIFDSENSKFNKVKNDFIEATVSKESEAFNEARGKSEEMKHRMENAANKIELNEVEIPGSGGHITWKGKIPSFLMTDIPGTVSRKNQAAAIRAAAKSNSKKDQVLKAAKEFAKEEGGDEEDKEKKEGDGGGEAEKKDEPKT